MKKPSKMIEGDVKSLVKKVLDAHDWFWFMPPANAFGRNGISDFIALKDGVFLAIETKIKATQVPSPMQIAFLNSVRSQHGFGFTVHRDNIKALEHWLNAFAIASKFQSEDKEVPPEVGSIMLNSLAVLMLDGKKETMQ